MGSGKSMGQWEVYGAVGSLWGSGKSMGQWEVYGAVGSLWQWEVCGSGKSVG